MHFVYKMDNLFRSIRVSDENSSITKGFHFFELIWTPDFLCVPSAPFKTTSSILNPFCLHLLFFMHLLIILSYMTLKLKSTSNELWKGWKLAWYHHFTHIASAKKLRGLREKLDALRVQNGQSLSKYQGFERKLMCYQGISLLNWTPEFLYVENEPFKATSSSFNPFWLRFLFFMHLLIFLSYMTLKLKSTSNELWNGCKLAWCHHFTHSMC